MSKQQPLTTEQLAEIDRQLVPNEEDRVCNRCHQDYTAGGEGDRYEHSAFCDSCAQKFCSEEAHQLVAVAREHTRLVSAMEFLQRSDRHVCLVVDYRAPGEATFQTRAFAAIAVATELGWDPESEIER